MRRIALVVGINTYKYLNPLKAPANDAEVIGARLESLGFQVIRLPGTQKSDGKITLGKSAVKLSELKATVKKLLQPDPKQAPDTVLLYFSGHGTVDEMTGEGFLASSDVNSDQGNYGLSLHTLQQWLRDCPSKQQIIWLDCCNSGKLDFSAADAGYQGYVRDRCFITAAYDEAFELLTGHGALTSVLIQALDPSNYPSGWITNLALVDFLNRQWQQESSLQTYPQVPIYANYGYAIDLTLNHTSPVVSPSPIVCPYKGLSFFDFNEEDPKYFFGRTKLISQLIEQVQKQNFLAVLGASGSGKSSVVRAGLLHELKQGRRISGSAQWKIQLFRPGVYPLGKLENALKNLVDESEYVSDLDRQEQLDQVINSLRTGGELLGRFFREVKFGRVVLAIDQFEEIFTQCQNPLERQHFLECLLGAIEHSNNKLCVVLVMRSDFLDKCAEKDCVGLAQKLQQPHLVVVPAMTDQELEEAIVEPAKRVGAEIESSLVKQMLVDVGSSSGNLPLLQYTLTELWKQRSGNRLTPSAYISLGGVMGTLEKQANDVYGNLSPDEQKATKRIFLALTHVGDGDNHTRKRAYKQNLITSLQSEELIERVIQKLTNRNLLVTSYLLEKSQESHEASTVEVAHEALIRHWSQLRGWVNENRDALRKQQSIEKAADEWWHKQRIKDPAYLLQGLKLEDAEEFVNLNMETLPLSSVAQELIQVSREERERLKREEKERNQREKQHATLAGIAAVLVILTSSFWWQQKQETEQKDILTALIGPLEGQTLSLDQLTKALNIIQNGEAGDLSLALARYRNLRRVTASSEKNNIIDSSDAQSIHEKIDDGFARLLEKRINQVEAYLKSGKHGSIRSIELTYDSEIKFGKNNALRETYDILMIDSGADMKKTGQIENDESASQMPCEILKKLEDVWKKTTSCSWYNSSGKLTNDDGERHSQCKVLKGNTLTGSIFTTASIYPYVQNRLADCNLLPSSLTNSK